MRKISPLTPLPTNLKIDEYEVIFGQADNHYSILTNQDTSKKSKLKFRGYNDEANKIRVRNLASGCCAYCGIRINNTSTETVEPFRAKAEFQLKKNYLKIN